MPCKKEENKRSAVKNLYCNRYRFFVALLLRMTLPGRHAERTQVSAGIRTSDKAVRLQRNLMLSCNNRSYSICSDCHVASLLAMTYSLLIVHYSLRSLSGIPLSDCLRAPAAGYRNYATGALTPDGYGDYWSSSTFAADHSHAGYLAFNAANVKPLNNNPRSCGFAVRCVQHLQEVALLRIYSVARNSKKGVVPGCRKPAKKNPGTDRFRGSLVRLVRSMRMGKVASFRIL